MMHATDYQLQDTTLHADPHGTYARLRAHAPVTYQEGIYTENLWLVTRYADVQTVLRDHKRFVKNYRNTLTPEQQRQLSPEPRLSQLLNNHLLNLDGMDHSRLRALINKAFTIRMVNQLEGRVQQIADALLDQVAARGEMDLIDDYAFPLPIIVIAEMLGVPAADRHRFRAWSDAFVSPARNEAEWRQAEQLLIEFTDYLGVVFAERRQHPRPDLITALIQAEEAGDKLSEEELYSMVVLLIVAGHETTVNLIGNGTLALLQHPAQLAQLKAAPALMPNAVEELLRYDGPVVRATVRFATEDTLLGGQLIRRGQAISVALTSANRDESQFPDAATLDWARNTERHLAFGFGIHYCIGAPLARMEGRIALNTLLQRLPNLRLTTAVDTLTWRFNPILRGLQHLPVTWDAQEALP